MFHITKMLTQTKCDLTEALFFHLKVIMESSNRLRVCK